jgi:hypothetical protein
MIKEIIRLGSTNPGGFGGPESAYMNLIYSYFLTIESLNYYKFIYINQVGDDLDELVLIRGNEVHINIRYPGVPSFLLKSEEVKNELRLNLVHSALLVLSEKDQRIERGKLEQMRGRIKEHNFLIDIPVNGYSNKKNKDLMAQLIVVPQEKKYDFYFSVVVREIKTFRFFICSVDPLEYNIHGDVEHFSGQWINDNRFLLVKSLGGDTYNIDIEEGVVSVDSSNNVD